jgi:hypothetical protein
MNLLKPSSRSNDQQSHRFERHAFSPRGTKFGRIYLTVHDYQVPVQTLSSAVTHLGLGLGFLCAIVGFALYGAEGGLLGGLVGYFLGKTIQSVLWTLLGDYET